MEQLLLTIDVKCLDGVTVEGHSQTVVLVPFTGKAKGDFFNGEIIGSAVDTQRYKKDGTNSLSARYMIEGFDFKGKKLSTLGMGTMRLPVFDGKSADIDEKEAAEIIDIAIKNVWQDWPWITSSQAR